MPSQGYDEIMNDLNRHKTLFDFTTDNLGDDLMKITAETHQRSLDNQCSPDGTAWDKLNPKYEAWKSRYFPGAPMAYLFGIMANPAEVAGEQQVTPNEALYIFGVTDAAKEQATWFQDGNPSKNQPPRPFTGLDDIGVQLVDDRLTKHHLSVLKG